MQLKSSKSHYASALFDLMQICTPCLTRNNDLLLKCNFFSTLCVFHHQRSMMEMHMVQSAGQYACSPSQYDPNSTGIIKHRAASYLFINRIKG